MLLIKKIKWQFILNYNCEIKIEKSGERQKF